jgi:Mn-dependent DtxR family transcriptional regulator
MVIDMSTAARDPGPDAMPGVDTGSADQAGLGTVLGTGPAAGTDLATGFATGPERRPATDAERRALASVVRLRILRMCLYEPLTNRQIAERLEINPATTLHHVRTLADQGFLAAGDPRRGRRGSREIPYRATGKSWTLEMGNPPEAAGVGAHTMLQTFLAEVADVPASAVDTSRLGLQLSVEHEAELRSRLADLLDEFARRPHDPGGQRWSIFVVIHPEP